MAATVTGATAAAGDAAPSGGDACLAADSGPVAAPEAEPEPGRRARPSTAGHVGARSGARPLIFEVQGYGSHLLRRILRDKLSGQEASAPLYDGGAGLPALRQLPMFVWVGGAGRREHWRAGHAKEWQLVNYFFRGGAIGSKRLLLHNLRDFCTGRALGSRPAPPLVAFFPRAYDLRSPRELYAFLLDYVVTRAEAAVRKDRSSKEILSTHVPAAITLLQRLAHLQRSEFCAANGEARDVPGRASWSAGSAATGFSPDEWALVLGGEPRRPLSDLGGDAGAHAAALHVEAASWLKEQEVEPRRQFSLNGERGFWIVKDPLANCGRGISVFADLPALLDHAAAAAWNVIAQKYLEKPLLVGPDRRKCDVRLWVLVTSWNPAVIWAWSKPYLRLASRPFTFSASSVADPFVHLTNRTVQKASDAPSPKSGPPAPREEDEPHIWMLERLLDDVGTDFEGSGGTLASSRWAEHTWPRMLEAIRACVRATQSDVGDHAPGRFELFGFDFLLDAALNPWLLEANGCPDLCEDAGPTLRKLTEDAVQEMCELVLRLRAREIDLPTVSPQECDLAVSGAGRWQLCLREVLPQCAKEQRLRRVVRPMVFKAASVGPGARGVLDGVGQHREVTRRFMGDATLPKAEVRLGVVGSPCRDPSGVLAGTAKSPLQRRCTTPAGLRSSSTARARQTEQHMTAWLSEPKTLSGPLRGESCHPHRARPATPSGGRSADAQRRGRQPAPPLESYKAQLGAVSAPLRGDC